MSSRDEDLLPLLQKSPDELRTMAANARARVEESFQRCDTDGFLSQWADDITARIYELQARINAQGGVWGFPALLDSEGNEVSRTQESGWREWSNGRRSFVNQWVLTREQRQRFGRYAIPCGERSLVQKRLGLHEGTVKLPALAKCCGEGTGLSGAANAYVAAVPLADVD